MKIYLDLIQPGTKWILIAIEAWQDREITEWGFEHIINRYESYCGEKVDQQYILEDLYTNLINYTTLDAQRTIRGLGEQKVYEAYRQLNREALASTTPQLLQMRTDVQNPPEAKDNQSVSKAIVDWKRQRREYEELAKVTIPR